MLIADCPTTVVIATSTTGRRTSHDMESEEDLEFRLRQKCDEVRSVRLSVCFSVTRTNIGRNIHKYS